MSELPTRPFDYSNLSPRPAGAFYRAAAGVLPGVRKVQAQIVPYALAWQHANLAALRATGPLWVALGDSMSQSARRHMTAAGSACSAAASGDRPSAPDR